MKHRLEAFFFEKFEEGKILAKCFVGELEFSGFSNNKSFFRSNA